MSEVLDGSLDLVISVEICGPSGRVKFLLKVWFDGVNDQSSLKVGIGSEDL